MSKLTWILFVLPALAAVPAPRAEPAAEARPAWAKRVLIVMHDESDGRLAAVEDALAFWNQTLDELGVRARLIDTGLLVAPPMLRTLEGYTRQIWLRAGRSTPHEVRPPVPPQLHALPADIVVFLSSQVIFSFAWPIGAGDRHFVGIQTDRVPPLSEPNVSRNVIAHELGHALGLEHNGDTPTLMCGPCQHLVYRSEARTFFPLTAIDRARLLELHGRR